MEPLYKFIRATENNLPGEGQAYLIRYKIANQSHEGYYYPSTIRLFFKRNFDVQILQPVTIPDDWEQKEEEIREAIYQLLNEGRFGLPASKAHKLTLEIGNIIFKAPLKGEDRNDIDTDNSFS
jgi:hypothetical protein